MCKAVVRDEDDVRLDDQRPLAIENDIDPARRDRTQLARVDVGAEFDRQASHDRLMPVARSWRFAQEPEVELRRPEALVSIEVFTHRQSMAIVPRLHVDDDAIVVARNASGERSRR